MITPNDVRALATTFPEVTETDHQGQPSFRVHDRTFASLADDSSRALLRLDEAHVRRVVDQEPDTFTELTEGAAVIGVSVNLERVPTEQFEQLLRASWKHRAPSSIAHELDTDD